MATTTRGSNCVIEKSSQLRCKGDHQSRVLVSIQEARKVDVVGNAGENRSHRGFSNRLDMSS
jgi:hypothetical protein